MTLVGENSVDVEVGVRQGLAGQERGEGRE